MLKYILFTSRSFMLKYILFTSRSVILKYIVYFSQSYVEIHSVYFSQSYVKNLHVDNLLLDSITVQLIEQIDRFSSYRIE
jgi:hypothetical protein